MQGDGDEREEAWARVGGESTKEMHGAFGKGNVVRVRGDALVVEGEDLTAADIRLN